MGLESPLQQCRRFLGDQVGLIRLWTPEYIHLASPLLTAALVGPAAAHYVPESAQESVSDDDVLSALDGKLLELAVGRFAEYWEIGSFCLDLLQVLKTSEPAGALGAKGYRLTWGRSVLERAQFLKFGLAGHVI